MQPLTSKQQGFSQDMADPDCHMDQSQCYAAHYDTSNMLPATVYEEASRLAANPKVAARILELRDQAATVTLEAFAWDQKEFVKEALVNLKGARSDHQWAPANGALKLIGDATGLLSSHVDVNITHTLKPGMTLEELEARVQRLNALEAGVVEGKAVVLEDE